MLPDLRAHFLQGLPDALVQAQLMHPLGLVVKGADGHAVEQHLLFHRVGLPLIPGAEGDLRPEADRLVQSRLGGADLDPAGPRFLVQHVRGESDELQRAHHPLMVLRRILGNDRVIVVLHLQSGDLDGEAISALLVGLRRDGDALDLPFLLVPIQQQQIPHGHAGLQVLRPHLAGQQTAVHGLGPRSDHAGGGIQRGADVGKVQPEARPRSPDAGLLYGTGLDVEVTADAVSLQLQRQAHEHPHDVEILFLGFRHGLPVRAGNGPLRPHAHGPHLRGTGLLLVVVQEIPDRGAAELGMLGVLGDLHRIGRLRLHHFRRHLHIVRRVHHSEPELRGFPDMGGQAQILLGEADIHAQKREDHVPDQNAARPLVAEGHRALVGFAPLRSGDDGGLVFAAHASVLHREDPIPGEGDDLRCQIGPFDLLPVLPELRDAGADAAGRRAFFDHVAEVFIDIQLVAAFPGLLLVVGMEGSAADDRGAAADQAQEDGGPDFAWFFFAAILGLAAVLGAASIRIVDDAGKDLGALVLTGRFLRVGLILLGDVGIFFAEVHAHHPEIQGHFARLEIHHGLPGDRVLIHGEGHLLAGDGVGLRPGFVQHLVVPLAAFSDLGFHIHGTVHVRIQLVSPVAQVADVEGGAAIDRVYVEIFAHDLLAASVVHDAVMGLRAGVLAEALVVGVLLTLAAGDGQAPLIAARVYQAALRCRLDGGAVPEVDGLRAAAVNRRVGNELKDGGFQALRAADLRHAGIPALVGVVGLPVEAPGVKIIGPVIPAGSVQIDRDKVGEGVAVCADEDEADPVDGLVRVLPQGRRAELALGYALAQVQDHGGGIIAVGDIAA